jgi:tetratricopeptide (TPR) repeat protein
MASPIQPGPATPPPAIARRRRNVRAAAGILLAAVAIGLAAAYWSHRPPPVPFVDLSKASPAVRRTIERHVADLQVHPRSAWAWGRLGSILYAYRLNEPALAALREAARRDPRNPRWPYLQGIILLYQDPPAALGLLRNTVAICGSQPPAPRLRLARTLAEQGRWTEARPEIEALLGLRPAPAHALVLAAQDAGQQGDLPRAVDLARRASEDPVVAKPALNLLASLLARQGNPDASADAARRAATAPGGDLLADPFDAEALALREDPTALSEQVHPLMARGQLGPAAQVVGRMIQDHADYADTWLAAGRLEYLRRNLPQSEAHFRRHLQLEPRSVQGWFQLGMALLGQNRDADAAEAFAKAVEYKPDLSPAWHNRGLALGRLGRRDEAMAAFRQVLRYSPEHLDAYLLFADLHLQERRKGPALELLDQAALLNPADPRLVALRRKAAALP